MVFGKSKISLLFLGILCLTPLISFFTISGSLLEIPSVAGQDIDYDFSLLNESVHVYAQQDGGVLINYTIVFENYGDPFDYIDIGFPNTYYELSTVKAYWDDGSGFEELTSIASSSVIDIGVELFIPVSRRIAAGENGTLMVWGENPRMIYNDTTNLYYASILFSPTWFDADYCREVQQLTTYLHFPEGFFNGTLAKFYGTDADIFDGYYFDNSSLVYWWQEGTHTPRQFTYGIAFPDDAVDVVFPSPGNGSTDNIEDFIIFMVILGIIVAIVAIVVYTIISKAGKSGGISKKRYMPPAVAVEALGIHRGLTVVEAAAVMEVPLSRVVTMIVFGLLRKDLIRFEEGTPPKMFIKPKPKGIQPTYYEIMFMKTIRADGTISPSKMKRTLSTLIKTVARKLEGYSRNDTRLFYKRMMQSALQEMQKASTPGMQNGAFDKYAEWLLVAPDEAKRMNRYDHYYVPPWYYSYFWFFHGPRYRGRRYRPRTTSKIRGVKGDPRLVKGFTGSKSGGKSGGQPVGIPQIADGIATGAGNFSNAMVVGFAGMANGIARVFVPPPPRPRRSSYSGRSCACACACASCACACAGGGR